MKYIRWREDACSWETTDEPDAKVGELHPAGRFVCEKHADRRRIAAMAWNKDDGRQYVTLHPPAI